ncbi:hypothetical protein KC901_00775, partial [Patescibacteria group bacterium]|nr:hypothetical protein [Patescibacteria group bacterium]
DDLGVLGVVRDLLNETKETIFESPFSEWTSQWDSENTIEISTKPSYAAQGYSYELSVDTHRYFKSLPEKKGLLTLVSPDNTKILTMEVTENDTVLSIFDRTSKRTRQLSLQTFPEKCVWSYNSRDVYCGVPNTLAYGNEYPDTWYQGLETYNDSLWKVNTETMAETMISDLNREYSENIDIDSINIDSKGEYLYFIDKNNEFLWSYRLIDF